MTDGIAITWDRTTGRVHEIIAQLGEHTVMQSYEEPQWMRWSSEAEAAPKLLAALEESARARHECEVKIDGEWGAPPADRHDGQEFEGCAHEVCVQARETIKEARGET